MLINNVDNPVFVWQSINSRPGFERMICSTEPGLRAAARADAAPVSARGWNQPDSSPNCRRRSHADGLAVPTPAILSDWRADLAYLTNRAVIRVCRPHRPIFA
ncbi:hypothetical protein [Mycolicibacterium brisbanense]